MKDSRWLRTTWKTAVFDDVERGSTIGKGIANLMFWIANTGSALRPDHETGSTYCYETSRHWFIHHPAGITPIRAVYHRTKYNSSMLTKTLCYLEAV